jgi:hypothetical protein
MEQLGGVNTSPQPVQPSSNTETKRPFNEELVQPPHTEKIIDSYGFSLTVTAKEQQDRVACAVKEGKMEQVWNQYAMKKILPRKGILKSLLRKVQHA